LRVKPSAASTVELHEVNASKDEVVLSNDNPEYSPAELNFVRDVFCAKSIGLPYPENTFQPENHKSLSKSAWQRHQREGGPSPLRLKEN
jgi:hypothetical protein